VTMSPADLEHFRAGLRNLSPRQGPFERLLRMAIRVASWACGWRIEVDGVDRLPSDGHRPRAAGCVLAGAPHRAWIDPFLVLAAWPPDAARLVWVGDGSTMVRLWRRHCCRSGWSPPGAGGPRATQLAAGTEAGAAMAIFTRRAGHPRRRDARDAPGFAYLALRAAPGHPGAGWHASIVPVPRSPWTC
jgi:hypothetical protein